jgi:uncharacterized DUF497 family protein
LALRSLAGKYLATKCLRVESVIWKEEIALKLAAKHSVNTDEVEEVLTHDPHIRRARRGDIRGEDLYAAYGQTGAGRYLIVFFIYKGSGAALPISARDMTDAERRYFNG